MNNNNNHNNTKNKYDTNDIIDPNHSIKNKRTVTRLETEYTNDPYSNTYKTLNTIRSKKSNENNNIISPKRRSIHDIFKQRLSRKESPNDILSPTNDKIPLDPIYSDENIQNISNEINISSNISTVSIGTILLKVIAAIGVVYGDIGTSPIYTFTAIYNRYLNQNKIPPKEDILGGVSTLIWLITIVVCIKYCLFVMQAHYHGEGGTYAIYEKLINYNRNDSNDLKKNISTKSIAILSSFACAAASLLLGDCIITPAISVLSALEGITIVAEEFEDYLVGTAIIIILLLYGIQSYGTRVMGNMFGPILLLWFIMMIGLGSYNISHNIDILKSINPYYCIKWWTSGNAKFGDLSNLVLSVTGAEAMFADMGHFGQKPIYLSWFIIVYPALLIQYLGQGAYLLSILDSNKNNSLEALKKSIFWESVPRSSIIFYFFMIALATISTIAASQAVITGAFTLMSQASSLGFIPKLRVIHTNMKQKGQIYIGMVALSHGIICSILIFIAKSSHNLAAAYGAAVTSVFVITTIMIFLYVAPIIWNYSIYLYFPLFLFFMIFDLLLWGANVEKFIHGAWFPFILASLMILIMYIWTSTRKKVHKLTNIMKLQEKELAQSATISISIFRTKGIGIFLTGYSSEIIPTNNDMKMIQLINKNELPPLSLTRLIARFHVMPSHVLLISVKNHSSPFVGEWERIECFEMNEDHISNGSVCRIIINFGWAEPLSELSVIDFLQKEALKESSVLPQEIQIRLQNISKRTDKYQQNEEENDSCCSGSWMIRMNDDEIEPLSIFTCKKNVQSHNNLNTIEKGIIWSYNLLKDLLESNPIDYFHLPADNTTEIGVSVIVRNRKKKTS